MSGLAGFHHHFPVVYIGGKTVYLDLGMLAIQFWASFRS